MNYFLSNQNIKIPNMIYGTAWKKQQTADFVYEALKTGFKGIDTACQPKHYQEDLVGEGIAKAFNEGLKREEIYIQTKFTPIDGQDINNMPYLAEDSLEVQIKKSFETSKKNLKLDYIDSYILHSPIFPGAKLLKAWEVMSSFYKNKEVGQLGISNCYDLDVLEYLYKNVDTKPSIVQNRFYAQSSYDKEIRAWCKDKGIIYESFWSLTANPHILSNKFVNYLASKYDKSVAVVFYKFLNQIGVVPLNGTTSKTHMNEDLLLDSFELSIKEIEEISSLLK
ncbi:MAG: aldo/keto reductase family protein [Halarcobacter sp.]